MHGIIILSMKTILKCAYKLCMHCFSKHVIHVSKWPFVVFRLAELTCQDNPCKHKTVCTESDDIVTCDCDDKYTGFYCSGVWLQPRGNEHNVDSITYYIMSHHVTSDRFISRLSYHSNHLFPSQFFFIFTFQSKNQHVQHL